MATSEIIHSFLEEQPIDRSRNDNICTRFMRKKFKCLIIFFLAVVVFAEASMLTLEKVNVNGILERFLALTNKTESYVP